MKNKTIIIILVILAAIIYFSNSSSFGRGAQYSPSLDWLKGQCTGSEKIYNCDAFYCRDTSGSVCSSAYTQCAGKSAVYTCGGGSGGTACNKDDPTNWVCKSNYIYMCGSAAYSCAAYSGLSLSSPLSEVCKELCGTPDIPYCKSGAITSKCFCASSGGASTLYTTGYCCNGKYQTATCAVPMCNDGKITTSCRCRDATRTSGVCCDDGTEYQSNSNLICCSNGYIVGTASECGQATECAPGVKATCVNAGGTKTCKSDGSWGACEKSENPCDTNYIGAPRTCYPSLNDGKCDTSKCWVPETPGELFDPNCKLNDCITISNGICDYAYTSSDPDCATGCTNPTAGEGQIVCDSGVINICDSGKWMLNSICNGECLYGVQAYGTDVCTEKESAVGCTTPAAEDGQIKCTNGKTYMCDSGEWVLNGVCDGTCLEGVLDSGTDICTEKSTTTKINCYKCEGSELKAETVLSCSDGYSTTADLCGISADCTKDKYADCNDGESVMVFKCTEGVYKATNNKCKSDITVTPCVGYETGTAGNCRFSLELFLAIYQYYIIGGIAVILLAMYIRRKKK